MSLKHLSKPVECTTPRVNSNGNGRLWVTMMCRCRFISCNNCTTLVGDIDNGRGYACVGVECMWETSIPSSQFCSGPKTAIKKKSLIYLFIYLWLCWVFFAVRRLSLVAASQGYSSLWCTGFSLQWLLLLWSTGSSSRSTRAQ